MTEIDHATGQALPPQGLLTLTHVIYGLHAFSALTGLLGAAFIVTAFLSGWPSLIAVVLNYLKRGETRGTFLESHFRWQIRTFWFALLWVALAVLAGLTFIGLPLAWAIALLRELPEVVLCQAASGEFELVCRIRVPQLEDVQPVLDSIGEMAGVERVRAIIVLSTAFDRSHAEPTPLAARRAAALGQGELG